MALTTPRLNRYRHLPVMYLAEVTDRRGTLAEDLPHTALVVRDGARFTSCRDNRQRATPKPNFHKMNVSHPLFSARAIRCVVVPVPRSSCDQASMT
ncbi:hypothetical protein E2C01_087185 [Portunus trituberculatus]|uniref:Uncharacterized protein n=1 Tax=Portunus trituberculatus TaxID=210409 RepID=A0A5B7JCN6_PORTR|nr:hypothetical protein [Portunus trituberculatus]